MFYKTFYTNKFIPKNSAGCAYFCFIFIRPEYKDDFGLYYHELTHVEQFYKLPFLHGLLYRFNKKYRLKSEVEAYKKQLKYYDVSNIDLFANYIANDYNLDITIDEAKKLLMS